MAVASLQWAGMSLQGMQRAGERTLVQREVTVCTEVISAGFSAVLHGSAILSTPTEVVGPVKLSEGMMKVEANCWMGNDGQSVGSAC